MSEGDLIIYTDSWGDKKQALFIRCVTETIVEIIRLDGLRCQVPTSLVEKGVLNEHR